MTQHIHIHAPSATAKDLMVGKCHDCGKRTRFLSFFTPWYGYRQTCLKCGREWIDGEWMPLIFARGSRQRNIEYAKKLWRSMPPRSANHYGLGEVI